MLKAPIGPMGAFFAYVGAFRGKLSLEGCKMKEKDEERKPLPWEAADPKVPIIQSGHFENRKCH